MRWTKISGACVNDRYHVILEENNLHIPKIDKAVQDAGYSSRHMGCTNYECTRIAQIIHWICRLNLPAMSISKNFGLRTEEAVKGGTRLGSPFGRIFGKSPI